MLRTTEGVPISNINKGKTVEDQLPRLTNDVANVPAPIEADELEDDEEEILADGTILRGRRRFGITRHQSELPNNFRQTLFKIMSKGGSEIEVMARYNIPKKVWNEWLNSDPDFRNLITVGLARSESWWVALGNMYAMKSGNSFNAALWFMNMKNRFGWQDKKELDLTSKGQQVGYVLLPELAPDPEHPGEQEPIRMLSDEHTDRDDTT